MKILPNVGKDVVALKQCKQRGIQASKLVQFLMLFCLISIPASKISG